MTLILRNNLPEFKPRQQLPLLDVSHLYSIVRNTYRTLINICRFSNKNATDVMGYVNGKSTRMH